MISGDRPLVEARPMLIQYRNAQQLCGPRGALRAVWVSMVFGLAACSGGGSGSGGTAADSSCDEYGVVIKEPTVASTYSVSVASLALSGIAPLAQKWDTCYPCVPSSAGVTVSWTNVATGATGTAYSTVRIGWFLGLPFYTHVWWDSVPLQAGDNLIRVTATEDGSKVGQDCITGSYVPDAVAPSIPSGLLAAAISSTEINLSWNPSSDNATTDDAAVYYKLYRDGVYLRAVTGTDASDTGLSPGSGYCYAVAAVDTADNESPPSLTVCETTLDQAEPTVPGGLGAIITPAGKVELAWDPSSDDVAVVGYKIYRNGAYLASVATTDYTDAAVVPDTRYCYTVSAYDQSANDSALSSESCTDTSWSVDTVDAGSFDVGEFSAITVDSLGAIHIGYHDGALNKLKYAANGGGAWAIETIDSSNSGGQFPAIAVDSTDFAHMVYHGGPVLFTADELKYASNSGGIWTSTLVAGGGLFNSLALDAQDYLHVSYISGGLRYATNRSGSWQTQAVAPADAWSAIAVDTAGGIHITSYQGYPEISLIYTSNPGGVWVSEAVDTNTAGEFNDLALDAAGNAHISYCAYFGGLRYATNASGTWQTQVLDPDRCSYTSVAVDSSGHVHISYIKGGEYLGYASNSSGSWLKDSLDKVGSLAGNYYAYGTSIVLDATDDVHISYYGVSRDLKYLTTR